MTDREVMQMALDAFEDLKKSVTKGGAVPENWDAYYEKEYYALEALRQALAQPEQDNETYGYAKRLAEVIWEKHYKKESPHWRPFHDVLGVLTQIDNMTCGLEKAQPEQEPVAWKKSYDIVCALLRQAHDILATTQYPIKREWVGLTVDEILSFYKDHIDRTMFVYIVQTIEAKLKEKNT